MQLTYVDITLSFTMRLEIRKLVIVVTAGLAVVVVVIFCFLCLEVTRVRETTKRNIKVSLKRERKSSVLVFL